MEIENGGGEGTAGSHFEQRIALNELMGGVIMFGNTITNMTLALMLGSYHFKLPIVANDTLIVFSQIFVRTKIRDGMP
jgi:hypothetical protein